LSGVEARTLDTDLRVSAGRGASGRSRDAGQAAALQKNRAGSMSGTKR
jgi:hypothetical protein